ncbi:MAG: hypothetical protein PHE51_04540 [Eubacteriales bacterium]|nr:hypothetical protein [Eubacteriales bacterium]
MDIIDNNENQMQLNRFNSNQQILESNGSSENGVGSSRLTEFYSPPQENFETEEMQGTMQHILSENIGEFVLIEFIVGTDSLMRKQGILYNVGRGYVTLYDEFLNNFVVCDIFSIKFVYFYLPGDRPDFNFNMLTNNNRPINIVKQTEQLNNQNRNEQLNNQNRTNQLNNQNRTNPLNNQNRTDQFNIQNRTNQLNNQNRTNPSNNQNR